MVVLFYVGPSVQPINESKWLWMKASSTCALLFACACMSCSWTNKHILQGLIHLFIL